ncbi:MAG: hypothetical protein DSY91_00240 [Deltaproteobacteria bacterium]|nr:MAG: hypothetical protein DSY91_00240 [Deltaproteobacteria bacterium]
MTMTKLLPLDLANFLIVTLFSLLIGMEQRRHHIDTSEEEKVEFLFGTDRTFTLIGILGFILYIISPKSLIPFLIGIVILSVLLGIYYVNKIQMRKQFGLTSIIIALITYCLTPLIYLTHHWLVMLIVVTVLIFVEIKESLFSISMKFGRDEFTTLAKFIIIAGVILPLLPHHPISKQIHISPYQFWLAIVAVSGISYFSYLLKKFFFPKSGTIITSLLGGLYSSTATTIILAKKSKEERKTGKTPAAIISATGVMYIRILLLALLFNTAVAWKLLPPFLVLILLSALMGFLFMKDRTPAKNDDATPSHRNPLEFKTALIFGGLFGFFAVVTNLVITRYGNLGAGVLSLIVGVTDIDPYILNLFQGDTTKIGVNTIVMATIVATASNNLMKMIYALVLGSPSIRKRVISGFVVLILVSFGFALYLL